MAFRDIRDDLRQRLEAVQQQAKAAELEYDKELKAFMGRHREKMDGFTREFHSLKELLQTENRRFGSDPEQTQMAPEIPLADFFVNTLANHGPRSKEELRQAAEQKGYFPAGERAGRATHTTLLNILRAGRIIETGSDTYSVPPKPAELDLATKGTMQ